MNNYLKALPALFAAAALMTGCGGDSSQDGGGQAAFRAGLEGRLTFAGGLAGADVFIDLNDDGEAGALEPYAKTDNQGFFSYNPLTGTNYCADQRSTQYIYCLRLPSSLPNDEVVIIYSGGYKVLTGEPSNKRYRIVIDHDSVKNTAIELDAGKTLATALAEQDNAWEVLNELLTALLAHVEAKEQEQGASVIVPPAMFSAFSTFSASSEMSVQEKYDALKEKGIFDGIGDQTLDENMDKAQVARISALILGLDGGSQSQPTNFADVSSPQWLSTIIVPALPSKSVPIQPITWPQLTPFFQSVYGPRVDDEPVSDWAKNYIEAALESYGLPEPGTLPQRELMVQLAASITANPDSPVPTSAQQARQILNDLITGLKEDEGLNDSFTEEQFEDVINGLFDLVAAADDDEILDVDGLLALLNDEARDLGNLTPENFVIPSDLFNDALGQLQGKLIRLGYSSNDVEGNDVEGKAALRLTSTGQLQACLQYDGVDELASPLYVTGEWQLLNANSIKVDFFIGPVLYDTRVLKLDRAQLALPELKSLKFDLASASADWDLELEDVVSSGWNAVVAAKHCGTFLNDG